MYGSNLAFCLKGILVGNLDWNRSKFHELPFIRVNVCKCMQMSSTLEKNLIFGQSYFPRYNKLLVHSSTLQQDSPLVRPNIAWPAVKVHAVPFGRNCGHPGTMSTSDFYHPCGCLIGGRYQF
jgi:hypothetical protein